MIKRILKRLLRPNYSNGQWHSWYGGACPVAPDAWVQGYVYVESDVPMLMTSHARVFDWEHENDPICRFRVLTAKVQHRPGDVRDTAAAMIPADMED